jgi:hypothetical protein
MSASPHNSIATEIGIDSFSAFHGVSQASAVALVAAILGGVAGPEAWLETGMGPSALPRLDLIVPAEDDHIAAMIDRLIHPVEQLNRRLAENMERFDSKVISQMVTGVTPGKRAFKLQDKSMEEIMLSRHTAGLESYAGLDGSKTAADLEFDPIVARKEAMLHPRFFLKDPSIAGLAAQVGVCHLRTALVVFPRLESSPGTVESRPLNLLVDLMTGRADRGATAGRDSYLKLNPRTILTLSSAALEAVIGLAPEMGYAFLVLSQSEVEIIPAEIKEHRQTALDFYELFRSALQKVVTSRRAGEALIADLPTDALDSYHGHERYYRQAIRDLPRESQAMLKGLPQAILWTLTFLLKSTDGRDRVDGRALVSYAFRIARQLVNGQREQSRAGSVARIQTQGRELAGKIVAKINSNGTLTMRAILQSTHQKKERVEPLLFVLMNAGVLEFDNEGGYRQGTVRLENVLQELDFSGGVQGG